MCASLAYAAPSIVSDLVAPGTAQCGVYVDAQPKVTVPVTAITGGVICKFDVATISTGSHSVQMTAIAVNDPVWGSQESGKSVPLTFVRPAQPTVPVGLVLVP